MQHLKNFVELGRSHRNGERQGSTILDGNVHIVAGLGASENNAHPVFRFRNSHRQAKTNWFQGQKIAPRN